MSACCGEEGAPSTESGHRAIPFLQSSSPSDLGHLSMCPAFFQAEQARDLNLSCHVGSNFFSIAHHLCAMELPSPSLSLFFSSLNESVCVLEGKRDRVRDESYF